MSPCKACEGYGIRYKEASQTFTVPKFSVTGDCIKLTKKGHQGRNGNTGDLMINLIVLPHEKFVLRWHGDKE